MSLERTLHHFPLDPASRQVRLALGEKRLAFTEAQVRYWERPKALTKLNKELGFGEMQLGIDQRAARIDIEVGDARQRPRHRDPA